MHHCALIQADLGLWKGKSALSSALDIMYTLCCCRTTSGPSLHGLLVWLASPAFQPSLESYVTLPELW
jgi:hypothetical protein